jgi:hypothetical protein
MVLSQRSPILVKALACWNWKCALLSALARSLVYLVAMARAGHAQGDLRSGLAVILVEMAYVTLTAGVYAGMQQMALNLRSRLYGNLAVVVAIPGLAQALDWLTHRAAGAPAPGKATLAMCIFGGVSALFHLYVMRRGAFLTGCRGLSLLDDFRRMPGLVGSFFVAPAVFLASLGTQLTRRAEPDAAL